MFLLLNIDQFFFSAPPNVLMTLIYLFNFFLEEYDLTCGHIVVSSPPNVFVIEYISNSYTILWMQKKYTYKMEAKKKKVLTS